MFYIKPIESFLNENIKNLNDYYILYHSTDSDFFEVLSYENATKGERFFNPLGNGLYCSSHQDFTKRFGKNTYYYLLPKKSKIKKITFKSWTESNYLNIVKSILRKYKIDYWNDIDINMKLEINTLGKNPPIVSLNELSYLLESDLNLENVKDVMESVVDKINQKYDAIWYKDSDHYTDADEIVIPTNSFNSQLFFKELPISLNENLNNSNKNYTLWKDLSYETKEDIFSNLVDSNYDFFSSYYVLGGSWLLDDIDKDLENKKIPIIYKPVKELTKSNNFLNHSFSQRNLDNLVNDLKYNEIKNPIILLNGEFFDGGHRLKASELTNKEYIPTIDISGLYDFDWESYFEGRIGIEDLEF